MVRFAEIFYFASFSRLHDKITSKATYHQKKFITSWFIILQKPVTYHCVQNKKKSIQINILITPPSSRILFMNAKCLFMICLLTHTHIHTHTHTNTHTLTHTRARALARTHTRTHAPTHVRAYSRTHTRTHTHVTCSQQQGLQLIWLTERQTITL